MESLDNLFGKKFMERIDQMRDSHPDHYKIIGVDMFDGTDWIEGIYDAEEEAFEVAHKERKIALGGKPEGPDQYMNTQYHVYAPNGDFLGHG